MSQKPKVNTGLTEYGDRDALFHARVSYLGLKDNPFFPHPDVSLMDYLAAINDFDIKSVIAYKGLPPQTAAKNEARIILNDIYSIEAHYVNRISNGNLEMLLSSKFDMTASKEYAEIADFAVTNGINPGDLDFAAKSIAAANSYEIEVRIVSETAPNDWAHCTTMGGHKETMGGFISGVEYEFRMRPIYTSSKGPFFNSVIIRVL